MEVINPNSNWEQQPMLEQKRFCSVDLVEEVNEKHHGQKMVIQRLNQPKSNSSSGKIDG